MATLHLLGTGAAVGDPHRTTTMLAFESGPSVIAVDCGGDLAQRMMQAGLDPARIEALIITHEHPDHVSGFPLFMEKIWLLGRRDSLSVYGIGTAIDQARRLFATFDTSGWEGLPEIAWQEFDQNPKTRVFENDYWSVTSSLGTHSVPVIGLRVEDRREGGVVAYSCDTERCEAITALAQNADILVHEATGAFPSHSTAEQAAMVARDAGAKKLLLVHLPPERLLGDLAGARAIFPAIEKGEELGRYEF